MAGVIEFKVENMDGVQDLLARMEERGASAAVDGIHRWLEYTFEVSQQVVPKDSGHLADTGEVIKTQRGGAIRYTANYARSVHDGYRRHFVEPRRRRALRWEPERKSRLAAKGSRSSAKWAFSKGHYVPAKASRSKPNPWLRNSVRKTLSFLGEFILEEWREQTKTEAL